MNDWRKMSIREVWDLIDSVYLKPDEKIDDLMDVLGLDHQEFLRLRKKNLPVPEEAAQKFVEIYGVKPRNIK